MIRLIVAKELRELVRTNQLVWLSVGIITLVGLALYNGYTHYYDHSTLLRESQQTTYQQFINQGDKNPHLGAHFGFYAYKPTADLGILENGIEDYTGNSFYLEPHQRGIVRFREVSDATSIRSFGFLNIGYFVQFVLPLFIFLICHNIFAKEWENGTIKMVLSSRISPRQLFTGKLLACLLLIGSILVITTLISLGLLVWKLDDTTLSRSLPAFGCYVLGIAIYALLMTIMGVSVSLLTRSSTLSLVVLAGFWLLGVFLIPRLSGEVSKQIHPSITSLEFDNQTFHEKQYGVGNEGHKDVRREKLLQATLKQYGVKRIEDLPVYFIPITIEYFEESDGKVMDRAYGRIQENDGKQNGLVLVSSLLSPFLAFRDFSMHLTATDMDTHNDFAQKAEEHRRRVGVIVDDFYQKNTVATNAFWRTIPQFSYTAPGLGWRINKALSPMAVLLVWMALAVGLVLFSYRRLTV